MECEAVRQLLEETPPAAALQEHLEQCAACRQEAALSRRFAAAVGAMLRVPAPDGFVDEVMAAVRGQFSAEPSWRVPVLRLRPWELGWIGVACLAVLVLLARLFPGWSAVRGAPMPGLATSDWLGRLQSLVRDGTAFFERSWEHGSARLAPVMEGSGLLVWLCGAAAFAAAFFLLLSLARWSAGAMEDAHA